MNDHVIVCAPKIIYIFGLGALGFGLILLLLLIFESSEKEAIGYMLVIFFVIDGAYLLNSYYNYRLVINGEYCAFKSEWGRKREFALSDIDFVEKSNQGLRVYSKSGKMLCKISYIAVGIMEVDAYLKKKNVSFRMRGSCSCWR